MNVLGKNRKQYLEENSIDESDAFGLICSNCGASIALQKENTNVKDPHKHKPEYESDVFDMYI